MQRSSVVAIVIAALACPCGPAAVAGDARSAAAPAHIGTGGPAPAAKVRPRFPRLAGMLIGDPHNYDDPTYQRQVARLDLAILGMYNGWGGDAAAASRAVDAIKRLHPDILLGNYTIVTEVANDPSDAATAPLRDKLGRERGPQGIGDWWAYDSQGRHTDWAGGSYGSWDTNVTLLTTPDAAGDHWPQWLASNDYQALLSKAKFDIWYSDNNMWRPRSNADWNRDGHDDNADDIAVRDWWRDGQRAYYDRAKALAPDRLLMLNADSDLDGTVFPGNADAFRQYRNVAHGAYLEHVMGESWSAETWGGWSTAMNWYHHVGGNLIGPKIVVFDVLLSSVTDYKTLRYALASCLMDDGYFSASIDYHQIAWFDEFDLGGTAPTSWLGTAIDPPQSAAWQSGVYRRRFEHGMALVNPKGNGARTVTIPAGYHRFNGRQAPDVNDGRPVSSLSLADRDGILLVKDVP